MVKEKVSDKARALKVLRILQKYYPHVTGFLHHNDPLQLLVAVILSAQCTDERVNKVTPPLFRRFRTVKDFANATPTVLEKLIYSTGFYKAKAKSIIGCCKAIVETHFGRVPNTLEALTKLPGVGRKTANVILCQVWHIHAIVVDTHVKRVSGMLGFTKNTDPTKIEHDLMALFPKKDWNELNFKLVQHGRKTCIARRPKCPECPVAQLCPGCRI